MNRGRPKKPKELHELEGTHMAKEELEDRANSEISLGNNKFKVTSLVRENPVAFKKWKEVTKLYKDANIEFVSSSDSGILERYAVTYSEYIDLVGKRYEIGSIELPVDGHEEVDAGFEMELGGRGAQKLWNTIEYILSVDGIIKIDKAINSKMKSLLDLEDRIFLNPVSKIRSIPAKTNVKKRDNLSDQGFDV